MISLCFSRELRLLTPSQFSYVFQEPQYASTPEITILARQNNLGHPRLGLAIAKKYLKRAHDRNLVKRLSRESFRLRQNQLPSYDFVILAKHGIRQVDNQRLFQALDKLWKRHIHLAQKSS